VKALVASVLLLAAVDLSRLVAPTNSRQAVREGISAYGRGDFRAAERAFREAAKLRPSATTSFDLGTAQAAAGNHSEGSALLTDAASSDPALRPDALYNRGHSALSSRAYDRAVRDFEDVLRLRPGDAAARRNLEIALRRQAEQQQQQGEQKNDPAQQQTSREKRPQEGQGEREGEKGETDAEALLRSVEQQEREELSRMRRSRNPRPRIGW
jgi:tetratricopeptide (TPR) repeat protein